MNTIHPLYTDEQAKEAFETGRRIALTVTDETSHGSHGEARKAGYEAYTFLAKCFALGFEWEREKIKAQDAA